MMPTHSPAHAVIISPEGLEVANVYLTTQSIEKTAQELCVSKETVSGILSRPEIRSYIDNIFLDSGFNNRFKLRALMDAIITKKLQDMDEADTGSTKDISELLALSHKMTMEEMSREIELEKLRQSNIRTQTNIQINDGGNNKYESLIQKLINGTGL